MTPSGLSSFDDRRQANAAPPRAAGEPPRASRTAARIERRRGAP